jgi:NAD(P)-dependent dehydrogenase (short-subunit alcohol dehydrogenase family)
MDKLFDVAGKVVVITGGSRGLGRAMSLAFAERGAKVVVASRKLDSCEALAQEINAKGGEAMPLAVHVGQWGKLDAALEAVLARYGRIDVLINNAGMSPIAPSLLETSEDLFDKIVDINLKGPTRLTALAATAMAKTGGGAIINISSIASTKPNPLTTTYSAAKAGLNVLTKAASAEYGPVGVRVNCIICGTFRTDATAAFTSDPESAKRVSANQAIKRVGEPEEVVGAALYFASAASSYTTGACLAVDGGVPA